MSAEADEYRALVQAEIVHHLQVHGPRNWDELRAKHPSVNERTFFRWVKTVRERPDLVEAAMPVAAKRARVESLKHLPTAPSPAYIAREGADAVRHIDFLVAAGQLYEDAEDLRTFAAHPRAEGEKRLRIKNPIPWDASINRRQKVLELVIRTLGEVYSLERMKAFYDIIVDEIGKADPRVQQAILTRLADVNAKHGFTIHAGA